jgi:hypothetical protein
MPEITKAEAERMISREGPYFIGMRREVFPNAHQFRSHEKIDPELLRTFLVTVKAWRVLCFDTESDGKLLYKVGPDKGKPGRIPVIFGNPDGQVLVFHDARQTPQELIDICADFAYVKIQSGIENDIRHLKTNGFPYIRNAVDLQTLLLIANPTSDQCGIEAATRYVWEPIDGEPLRTKWSFKFNPQYVVEKMEKECLRHSVQDLVVPYAIMLKVALEITKLRQTDAYVNIFPALNEALELCMSKSPANLRNENGGCLKPTLRKNLINDDCLSWSTPFQLNAHRFVQLIRRARGDLIENFDSGLTWAQIIERAQNHLAIMSKLPNANQNCSSTASLPHVLPSPPCILFSLSCWKKAKSIKNKRCST